MAAAETVQMARDKPWAERFAGLIQRGSRRVFTRADLDHILLIHGMELGAPKTLRVGRFITVLVQEEGLREIEVKRESRTGGIDTKTRYAFGDVSPYAVAASLMANAYLSHASAMFLHALTDQVPKTVYVNREQSPKPKPDLPLRQAAINRAFKRPPRVSTYVFTSEEARFVLLSGKNTGRLEVAPVRTPRGEWVDATKLERTLIDIVVRPTYAGGPREVLQAYQTAAPRISVNTLLATLRTLDYVYPYHQSVGFFLQRAGFPEQHLAKVEALGVDWDFYVAHQIPAPQYDSRWRVYYPEGL